MVTLGTTLVIVPTHDHASTLDLAVTSALEQSVEDIEVVVIGDGVGDDTRDVIAALVRADRRVRFLDLPKSVSRNEEARHEVISGSGAGAVTYLGDDDLFLADHVETMLDLLRTHDFAHPFPVFVGPHDRLWTTPTDLADPPNVAWHLQPRHNTVSLTGASHTVEFYRRLPVGWVAAPPGVWPDHHMWQQVFAVPGARLATARRSTTVKPPAAVFGTSPPAQRRATLARLRDLVRGPDGRRRWDELVTAALFRDAAAHYRELVVANERLEAWAEEAGGLRSQVASAAEAIEAARDRCDELERALSACTQESDDQAGRISALELSCRRIDAERASLQAALTAIEQTRTWRLRSRLTRIGPLRALLARQSAPDGEEA